ncbi:hypothetical protein JCGZ_07900 [Jatropha curcas]|uniref:Uncharacterized protein n=1 Tax=Jatropha curcas TaxID=180498 RepID=A0A067KKN6_JATCU|nr:hypothetical protein JCGZ_07900 [Jatropha curcas]
MGSPSNEEMPTLAKLSKDEIMEANEYEGELLAITSRYDFASEYELVCPGSDMQANTPLDDDESMMLGRVYNPESSVQTKGKEIATDGTKKKVTEKGREEPKEKKKEEEVVKGYKKTVEVGESSQNRVPSGVTASSLVDGTEFMVGMTQVNTESERSKKISEFEDFLGIGDEASKLVQEQKAKAQILQSVLAAEDAEEAERKVLIWQKRKWELPRKKKKMQMPMK